MRNSLIGICFWMTYFNFFYFFQLSKQSKRDPLLRKTDEAFSVATSTAISEDLGQVEYLFSDKTGKRNVYLFDHFPPQSVTLLTGTLTENEMTLKKCALNGRIYGTDHPKAKLSDDLYLLEYLNSKDPLILDFFIDIALCHSLMPQKNS